MSVHKPARNTSRLDVHEKANEMVRHTVHICSNDRVFDPRYAAFTARIVDTAVNASQWLWAANNIRVNGDPRRWERRRDLQERSCEALDSLIYLIGVARMLYKLRTGKYEHWVRMVVEVRDLARRWRDSDALRYGHLDSGIQADRGPERLDAVVQPQQREQRRQRERERELRQQQR